VLLGLVVLYWLIVIVGALDIEVLEFLSGSTDGLGESVEGAAEGIDGAFEGIEGAVEGIDGAAEGLEGAAEGVEGAAEGIDGAGESAGQGVLSGVLGFAGVGQVPLTIILSVLILLMWLAALVMTTVLPAGVGDVLSPMFLWFICFGVVFALCFVATAFLLRPFRGVFALKTTRGHQFLVGRICRIKSGRVTPRYGQAELRVDDSFLLIAVRCPDDSALRKGDEAVITGYDTDRDVYEVTKL
jgi:membrane protein implicated in regulation of membrane protease activity